VTDAVGFLPAIAACAALGALRLQVARTTGWSLIAAMPLSVTFFHFRSGWMPLSTYIVATIAACLCLAIWWFARWATLRWLYVANAAGSYQSKKQIVVFAVLATAVLLTSLYGWFWMQVMEGFMGEVEWRPIM
jgi:hypothetical protein